MTVLSDERPSQAITVLLVEDDAPTCGGCAMRWPAPAIQVTAAATLAEPRRLARRAEGAAHRTAAARRPWHRADPRDAAAHPDTEIMVISILGDEQSVISAIMVGATGYLLKDAFPTDIAATVRDLVAGHSPISASIARFIVRRTQGAGPAGPALNTAKLTPREIDILWGIAKGFSYAEIAGHLGLSRQTVPGHIKSIYRKLEVNTRGEAVFEALQQGLIRL